MTRRQRGRFTDGFELCTLLAFSDLNIIHITTGDMNTQTHNDTDTLESQAQGANTPGRLFGGNESRELSIGT